MLPASSDSKHEPSLAAGDNFSHHKLLNNNSLCTSLRTVVLCFSLIQTRTEAGEGNVYLLVHGGARLQAGTMLSKAINQVILPLTGLSNSSFLSDRLLLHT